VKINPNWSFFRKELKISDQPAVQQTGPKNFSDTLNQQEEKSSQELLKKRMQQIELQGQRLAKSMTLRELRNYKLMVRQFLEDTIRRGVGIKETKGWDRRGRGRRYKLLEEIDRQLLEMTDELLEQEQGKIDILHKIGEIRGMLVNLLF
jgi:uncharacterized protein YaaR (DUF327 family)